MAQLQKACVDGDIVGPMTGNGVAPLRSERALESGQSASATCGIGQVDLGGPKMQKTGDILNKRRVIERPFGEPFVLAPLPTARWTLARGSECCRRW